MGTVRSNFVAVVVVVVECSLEGSVVTVVESTADS